MEFQNFSHSYAGVLAVIVLLTAGTLAVSRERRVNLAALAGQYAGVWVLVGGLLPFRVALGKLVAGWAVCGILALTGARTAGEATRAPVAGAERDPGVPLPGGWLFRALGVAMVAVTALTVASQPEFTVPGLNPPATFAAYALIGLGLLNLGFTGAPFRSAIGVLTALSGFELLYAAVEESVAVVGLLAAVHVAVALSASLLTPPPADAEGERAEEVAPQ